MNRLDIAMVGRGLADSRQRAKMFILEGLVSVNGAIVRKPSHQVIETDAIAVTRPERMYVSRAGLKLEKALSTFHIDVSGKVFADIGASTGGFTQCLLEKGAQRVYAVDVGTDQLAPSLRKDVRVIVMEQTNARDLHTDMFAERLDGMVMDVSFISITKILSGIDRCLEKDGILVALVKPQFEAGRSAVGKDGIVKDRTSHREVLQSILKFLQDETQLRAVALEYSPITGSKGNIEYLIYAVKGAAMNCVDESMVTHTVEQAHMMLKKHS